MISPKYRSHHINEMDQIRYRKESTRAANLEKGKGSGKIPHVVLGGVEHKSCARYGSLKPLNEFRADSAKWDGLQCRCKSCAKS